MVWEETGDSLQASFLGTDPLKERSAQNEIFLAGILFGLAGGAFVGGLQDVVVQTRAGWLPGSFLESRFLAKTRVALLVPLLWFVIFPYGSGDPPNVGIRALAWLAFFLGIAPRRLIYKGPAVPLAVIYYVASAAVLAFLLTVVGSLIRLIILGYRDPPLQY
jgi:hypothetical protein